jgi:hypothetical protein
MALFWDLRHLPIFTNSKCFLGYPLQAIAADVAEPLASLGNSGPGWRRLNSAVLRLECYLQVTKQSINRADLSSSAGAAKLAGFIAALYSSRFEDSLGQPWAIARVLRLAFSEAFRGASPISAFPSSRNRDSWPAEFLGEIAGFDRASIDEERATFWRGWTIRNSEGKQQSLRLWAIHERYGADVAAQIFEACDHWFRRGRACYVLVVQDFVDYLASLQRDVDFADSTSLGMALSDFFEAFFTARHEAGYDINFAVRDWNKFVSFSGGYLFGKAWATPYPTIPSPRAKSVVGSDCNVRMDKEGRAAKHSLITPVPLKVSDKQAKELLFRQIRAEHDSLLKVAREEIAAARTRVAERKRLAPLGVVSEKSYAGANTGLRFRISRDCKDYLAHASATLEQHGLGHLESGRAALLYPGPLDETAFELGLPLPQLLLAHATVLVANHPAITPSFLEHLCLYDKNGDRSGLVKTDAGWYLRGLKMRKGAKKAQQEILLNEETLQVVEDLIEMTRPLRDWLRIQKNDSWRRLFLATTSMGNAPTTWSPTHEASRQTGWLSDRFVQRLGIERSEADDLAARFSLKRLRASAGVLVYLNTGSVEQMAKALGHTVYSRRLLDHYLPPEIQRFFVERWIRLFQTGIVCEALKGSPYLLAASNFATMEDLDEFLENHALRRIPRHLEDPDSVGGGKSSTDDGTRVVFGIDVGILTILMSIECAVRRAEITPCGRAIRWAQISERLIPHLEAQKEQPEFVTMVSRARAHVDPTLVESLIHG